MGKSLFEFICPKPWMQSWEINSIKKTLLKLKPKRCLEWGSGNSTIYFTRFLPKESEWISIEHDFKWSRKIRRKLFFCRLIESYPKIKIFHIAPNKFSWTDKHGDGSSQDFKNYINFPRKMGKFDFILIDGRARKSCLLQATKLLDKNGIVVLHDASRKYYHKPFRLFKYKFLMIRKENKDSNGLWFGSYKINFNKLL